MEVLSKDIIERWIVPHLSKGERGPEPGVDLCDIVQVIFYRLKTGCQWRMLPVKAFVCGEELTWSGIYYHHREWIKDGSWKAVWVALLQAHKHHLDLSSMQLDGSQTIAKKQGEHISYQGRRKARSTNALFLCDNQGQPLALATPQPGHHNDFFELQERFAEICDLLSEASLDVDGVFMNADAGFDAEVLRQQCSERNIEANIDRNPRNIRPDAPYVYFDEELYKRRFTIEQTNAWLDGFKALLIRYEVRLATWIAQHFMAFTILFLRKLPIHKP